MFSSLSMDPGGPANALGASLGRGLSSLTFFKSALPKAYFFESGNYVQNVF